MGDRGDMFQNSQIPKRPDGGQGVVTAPPKLISVAAFLEGRKEAQAFPTFGSERTGAPVVAFCRIDDNVASGFGSRSRSPDAVIVQDPTLLHQVDLVWRPGGRRLPAAQYDPHVIAELEGSAHMWSGSRLERMHVTVDRRQTSAPRVLWGDRFRTRRYSAPFAALTQTRVSMRDPWPPRSKRPDSPDRKPGKGECVRRGTGV